MDRREFVKVWARYATTAFGLVYPVPFDKLAFVGVGVPAFEGVPLDLDDPIPWQKEFSPDWPIKGRVMDFSTALTGWFPLRNDQYELRIGKMCPCFISAMDYQITLPDGDTKELYVEVTNPQGVQDNYVTIRFAKEGIFSVEGYA